MLYLNGPFLLNVKIIYKNFNRSSDWWQLILLEYYLFPDYDTRTRLKAAFKSIQAQTCIKFTESKLALPIASRPWKFAVVFSTHGSWYALQGFSRRLSPLSWSSIFTIYVCLHAYPVMKYFTLIGVTSPCDRCAFAICFHFGCICIV